MGVKHKRFTPEEDEIIKAAIDEGNDDIPTISKQLKRNTGSVHNRVKLLKRSDGSRSIRSCFELAEDLAILETLALPRLQKDKLPNITLHTHENDVRELTQQLKRGRASTLTKRWSDLLQPYLLQHYSGTLNLRVERMLANHIVESYRDYSDIRWEEVADRREFAGHTVTSLKRLLGTFRMGAGRKFGLERSEVTLRNIGDYCELVYGEGSTSRLKLNSKVKLQRQQDVITFFERKVEELGIQDFL